MGKEAMNRRSFFKFLPVAPVVLVAEGARAVTVDQTPNDVSVKMTLHASKRVDGSCMNLHTGMRSTYPVMDPNRSVTMAVGEDGRLWIKSKDDVWKRVVTE